MSSSRERVLRAQIIELLSRSQDPDDSRFIDREMFQLFLEGRLVPRGELNPEAVIINVSDKIELLIKAGYHKVTNGGEGMKASQYRKLWPKTVTVPPKYVGRFDEVLLVDRTIKVDEIVKAGNLCLSFKLEDCEDLVQPPHGEDGQPLSRFIAFVQLGEKNLGRPVKDCCKRFSQDEIGLAVLEGLYLPVQHENYLRRFAVDIPGSQYDRVGAPYVVWFDSERPVFSVPRVQDRHDECGSASRGSVVIPVT